MCSDLVIRRFAGTFVLASLALGWFVNPLWFLFTAFVGANLLQSSFTGFCPLERILGRLRLFGCRPGNTPTWPAGHNVIRPAMPPVDVAGASCGEGE